MRNASVLPLPVLAAAKISLQKAKLEEEVLRTSHREKINPILNDIDYVNM